MEDFGVEAAAEAGVDLERTILVSRPKDSWLEATAALVDGMGAEDIEAAQCVLSALRDKLEALAAGGD